MGLIAVWLVFICAGFLERGHSWLQCEPQLPNCDTSDTTGQLVEGISTSNTFIAGLDLLFRSTFVADGTAEITSDARWELNGNKVPVFESVLSNNHCKINGIQTRSIVECILYSTHDNNEVEISLRINTSQMTGLNTMKVYYVSSPHATWKFTIIECTCYKENVTSNRTTGHLGDIGFLTCSSGHLVELGIPRVAEESVTTTCLRNATWSKCGLYECWSAPNTYITINGSESRHQFDAGDIIKVLCHLDNGDLLTSDNSTIFIQKRKVDPNFIRLTEVHNGNNIYCVGHNGFTSLVGHSDKRYFEGAQNLTLEVNFQPLVRDTNIECEASGGLMNCTVHFHSNPEMTNSSIQLLVQVNQTASDRHSGTVINTGGRLYGVQSQRFEVSILPTLSANYFLVSNGISQPNFRIPLNLSVKFEQETTAVQTTVSSVSPSSTMVETTLSGATSEVKQTTDKVDTTSQLPVTAIAGAAGGGALLLIGLLVFLILRRKRNAGSGKTDVSNPAFDESSVSGNQGNSERQECANVLYGTADDLKSGGNSSHQMVDNVLYGTTTGPQVQDDVYTTVNKTNKKKKGGSGSDPAAELYSSVQKPKKTKGKAKVVDPGASTSGLQSDDTYAEVNKDRKKKKDEKKTGKGQENSGFAGDAQQDATYAVVDKKKNKGAKGKKADEPGTSGLVEEATYAVVNKKDKKPKKDGPDDDLHGSNKA